MRNILGVIAGLVVGQIIIAIGMAINQSMLVIPDELKDTDQETFIEYMSTLSYSSFLVLILSFFVSTLVTATLASRIAHISKFATGLVAGGFMVIACGSFTVSMSLQTSIVVASIVFGMVGSLLGAKLSSK